MALPTSGTYNTLSITAEIIIRDAFENIGLPSEFLDVAKYNAAIRALNFTLQDWMSKSYNLWTIQGEYMQLIQGQPSYALPEYVSDIVQVNTRTFTRQLNGIAGSSSGIAQNAFDGDPYTTCEQDAPNGTISYGYSIDGSNAQTITFIGITSNTDQEYTLTFTSTPFPHAPKIILTIPKTMYKAGVTQWFDVASTFPGSVITMTETGGATLDIQELYFTNNTNDTTVSEVSLYNYQNFPQKYQQGRPSCYYIQRNTNNMSVAPFTNPPLLYLWPVPDNYWNVIQITYEKMMQDVTYLAQAIDVPARFYPALTWALTWRLAMKYKPEVAQMYKSEYEQSFREATLEDSEDVPITITISDSAGY